MTTIFLTDHYHDHNKILINWDQVILAMPSENLTGGSFVRLKGDVIEVIETLDEIYEKLNAEKK